MPGALLQLVRHQQDGPRRPPADLLAEWSSYMTASGCAVKTVELRVKIMRGVARFADADLLELTRDDLVGYLAHDLSPWTRYSYWKTCELFSAWLGEFGYDPDLELTRGIPPPGRVDAGVRMVVPQPLDPSRHVSPESVGDTIKNALRAVGSRVTRSPAARHLRHPDPARVPGPPSHAEPAAAPVGDQHPEVHRCGRSGHARGRQRAPVGSGTRGPAAARLGRCTDRQPRRRATARPDGSAARRARRARWPAQLGVLLLARPDLMLRVPPEDVERAVLVEEPVETLYAAESQPADAGLVVEVQGDEPICCGPGG